ncbi:unnamed protein product, partial [Mesorhabditis spiculigera]
MVRESSKIGIQTAASPNACSGCREVGRGRPGFLRLRAGEKREEFRTNAPGRDQRNCAVDMPFGRVRALVDNGVIRDFTRTSTPPLSEMDLQAMIAVRLQANAKVAPQPARHDSAKLDSVLNVYFVAGVDDYMLQRRNDGFGASCVTSSSTISHIQRLLRPRRF